MTDPGRFGEYVLLRRLSEDAVGERYRAALARGGRQDDGTVADADVIEDVVLLQLFDAPGADGQAIAAAMRRLPDHLDPILAPSIADDTGSVDGLPWARYPFRQTFGLRALLKRANGGFSTLGLEHAALISERLAKVLYALHRSGVAHSFVVPELLAISSEGEVCLRGTEHGPALLAEAVAARLDGRLRTYLAPEVRAGAEAEATDDVYALGAIFFELLTGTALDVESPTVQLDSALAIATDEPLPAGLRGLISASVAPRDDRIADAGVWHQQLAEWMAESGFASSNFDLAFLVHELFRDDLGRDERGNAASNQDPHAARVTPAVTASAVPTPASLSPSGSASPMAPSGTYESLVSERETPSTARRTGLLTAAAVAALLITVLALRMGGRAEDPQPAAPARVAAVDATPEDAEGTSPADATEGLGTSQADLERLVAERTSAVGKRLADDYDSELGALESEIEAARADLGGSPPSLVSMPRPTLPGDAASAAPVRVEVLVGEDGSVREARVDAAGLAANLAEAARTAALGARFSPATVDGAPKAQWTEVVVRFTG